MTRPALLDINLLIALFDPSHVHHETAHAWFAGRRADGWATCPMTELGFIRVLSSPKLGEAAQRVPTLLAHLRKFCASRHHQFWPETLTLQDVDLFDLSAVSSRQLTDVYLLGLACKRGGRLATLDRTIPVRAVVGGTRDALEILAPAGE